MTDDALNPDRRMDGRTRRGMATRGRVLDAAERLFGANGFDAVSIRHIAAEAEVTPGVVQFHGGTKDALFYTVVARRVAELNTERRARLAALRREGVTLRGLLDAYISPYLDYASRGDVQWRAYACLIARVATEDRWHSMIAPLYDPVAREFLDEIARLLPGTERARLAAAMTLTVAAMLSLVATRARLADLGEQPQGLPTDHRETLIGFCVGGFERIAAAASCKDATGLDPHRPMA